MEENEAMFAMIVQSMLHSFTNKIKDKKAREERSGSST